MEKKYLMLLPLAVPLFFGGKAAVTAFKRKTVKSNGEAAGTFTTGMKSSDEEIIKSDLHSDELRSTLGDTTGLSEPQNVFNVPDENEMERPDESQIDVPDEEEVTPPDEGVRESSTVNRDAELPEEENRSFTPGNELDETEHFEGKTILTGPKGGKYFVNESGKKIYLKNK
jgi:hypothetical protein